MNKIETCLPLDIFSVKQIGTDKWLKDDINWPIEDSESLSLVDTINYEYINILKNTKNERIKLLLISQSKIVLELSGVLHALIVLDRLKNKSINPRIHKSAIYYNSLLSDEIRIDGLYERYKSKLIPPQDRNYSVALKSTLLRIIKNKKLRIRTNSNTIYTLNSKENVFLTAYSKKLNKDVQFFPIYNIAIQYGRYSSELCGYDSAIQDVLLIMKQIGLKKNIVIPHNVLEYFRIMMHDALVSTNYAIEQYYTYLSKIDKSEFFIPSLGHIQYRAFSIAAKLAGHTTIGSTHGNSIGMLDVLLHAIIDLSFIDKYLVVTDSVAKNYKKLTNKYLGKINNPTIVSVDTDYYRVLFNKHKSLESLHEVKNIMVVEYPLTPTRHNVYSFWPYQLKLMLRIGKFISNQGINSIMKRHPDRLNESDGLYDEYYTKQLIEPFEDVFGQAEAYFFMNISSTTFGFAMTTNRPIFIFSIWLEEVWEHMIPSIVKRCIVIPSWIDENGILQYNEKYFKEKLKSDDIWDVDYEVVNKYMIPQAHKIS